MAFIPLAKYIHSSQALTALTVLDNLCWPVYAIQKALKEAGLSMQDMDIIELNEAFAAQCVERGISTQQ
eukprot:2460-Heterococcus_DN1.PRE.2